MIVKGLELTEGLEPFDDKTLKELNKQVEFDKDFIWTTKEGETARTPYERFTHSHTRLCKDPRDLKALKRFETELNIYYKNLSENEKQKKISKAMEWAQYTIQNDYEYCCHKEGHPLCKYPDTSGARRMMQQLKRGLYDY
ncbi:MAG: hypothetical protein LBM05_02410 [Endomicrobium sp.]|jgi:hypothetical protein|nr:hypothetical protein [Endomicrobium sp.]